MPGNHGCGGCRVEGNYPIYLYPYISISLYPYIPIYLYAWIPICLTLRIYLTSLYAYMPIYLNTSLRYIPKHRTYSIHPTYLTSSYTLYTYIRNILKICISSSQPFGRFPTRVDLEPAESLGCISLRTSWEEGMTPCEAEWHPWDFQIWIRNPGEGHFTSQT